MKRGDAAEIYDVRTGAVLHEGAYEAPDRISTPSGWFVVPEGAGLAVRSRQLTVTMSAHELRALLARLAFGGSDPPGSDAIAADALEDRLIHRLETLL